MKKFPVGLLAICVGLICGAGILTQRVYGSDPTWKPSGLEALIVEGLEQNPEIQSMAAAVESLQKEIVFAGSLEDPKISIGIANLPIDSLEFNQEPMTQKQLALSQVFPWFGTLDLKSQRAEFSAKQQQALLEVRRIELARQISSIYFELGINEVNLQTNQRLFEMITQILRIAESRYATGRSPQQDVFQAQIEQSRLLGEKIQIDLKDRILQDKINELLGREVFSPVSTPQDLTLPAFELVVERLKQQAQTANPWLKVRQAEIDATDAEISLARKAYYPNMDVRLAYGQRDESQSGQGWVDFVSASVTMNLPLWFQTRQDPKLEATLARHTAAVKLRDNLVRALNHQVDALSAEISETQKSYRLFNDALIVQAELWASASLTAYEVGTIPFDTLINAQVRLINLELQTRRLLFTVYQKLSDLEALVGGFHHLASMPNKKENTP